MVIRTSQVIPEMREGISINIVTFASHLRKQTCHGEHLFLFVAKEMAFPPAELAKEVGKEALTHSGVSIKFEVGSQFEKSRRQY